MGKSRAFAYPKRYAVLSLRLGTAFMFPADAQPEGEVPHTRRLPPSSLSSLSGGRAPPEVFPQRQADPKKPPAPFGAGGFSPVPQRKSKVVVKMHKRRDSVLAAEGDVDACGLKRQGLFAECDKYSCFFQGGGVQYFLFCWP